VHVRDEDVILHQCRYRRVLGRRDADLQGVSQRGSLQALNFAGECGGKEVSPALPGQKLENLLNNWTEVLIDESGPQLASWRAMVMCKKS
jgi:hypothetical protein